MEAVSRYFTELEQMMRAISLAHLERVLRLLEEAYLNGRRIFIMGNGGSAATASHFAPGTIVFFARSRAKCEAVAAAQGHIAHRPRAVDYGVEQRYRLRAHFCRAVGEPGRAGRCGDRHQRQRQLAQPDQRAPPGREIASFYDRLTGSKGGQDQGHGGRIYARPWPEY